MGNIMQTKLSLKKDATYRERRFFSGLKSVIGNSTMGL